MREQLLNKLTKQLNLVGNDIADLYLTRRIYRRVTEVAGNNPRLQRPSHLFDRIHRWYAVYACVSVRRILDTHGGTVSLRRIVQRLLDNPQVMTRELFVARRVEDESGPLRTLAEQDANRDFDEIEDRQECTPNLANLQRALDRTLRECETVKSFVDQRLAHHDEKPSTPVAKWGEMDRAIDAIGHLHNLASLLLTDSTTLFDATVLAYDPDWEWVLREPWSASDRSSSGP